MNALTVRCTSMVTGTAGHWKTWYEKWRDNLLQPGRFRVGRRYRQGGTESSSRCPSVSGSSSPYWWTFLGLRASGFTLATLRKTLRAASFRERDEYQGESPDHEWPSSGYLSNWQRRQATGGSASRTPMDINEPCCIIGRFVVRRGHNGLPVSHRETDACQERHIDWFVQNGWEVLIRDSEMPKADKPSQSGPNRTSDDEEC